LAEIANCSKADRRKQLTFPNELGELPASMRWEVQEGAILENNSVGVTVRIPSDYSDGTRDAQRLERTSCRPGDRSGLLLRNNRAFSFPFSFTAFAHCHHRFTAVLSFYLGGSPADSTDGTFLLRSTSG
jgi:hypothetical protein